MDNWQSIVVRAPRPDIVRRWAALEGKSPSMSEDLYRRYLARRKDNRNILAALGFLAELSALLLDAWRLIGSP